MGGDATLFAQVQAERLPRPPFGALDPPLRAIACDRAPARCIDFADRPDAHAPLFTHSLRHGAPFISGAAYYIGTVSLGKAEHKGWGNTSC